MLSTATLLLLVAVVGSSHVVAGNDVRRYQLLSDPLTWKEAEQNCRTLGMELVNIGSSKEQGLLQTLVSPADSPSVWVGRLNKDAEGRFLAKSGELLPENSPLLPSMEEDRDCLALHHINGVYLTSCTEENIPSICSAKPRPLISVVTGSPANLKSSIRRVIRSAEDCSTPTARSRKHKRRKSLRKYKKRRVIRRRGDLQGKMTGKMTGSMEGIIRGFARGTTTGVVSGTLRGALTGIFEGNATGEITGFMKGTLDDERVDRWTDGTEMGTFSGRLLGDFEGNAKGLGIGEWEGIVTGNSTGEFEGHMIGTFVGNLTGTLKGLQHEFDPENEDFTGFLGRSLDFVGTEPTHDDADPMQRATYLLEGETIGNMTGEMWGESKGELVGNIDGVFEGSSIRGAMEGLMNGSITGNMTGSLWGVLTGNLTNLLTGEVSHEENTVFLDEREDLNLVGNLVGVTKGSLVGSVEGSLMGHLEGNCTGSVFGVVQGKLWGTMGGLFDGEIVREAFDESTNLV